MLDNYPTKLEDLAQHEGGPLVCHGCGHSGAGAPYPGTPSGERPCCFCVRNVQREEWRKEGIAQGLDYWKEGIYGVTWTAFYDNSKMSKCPMDCYMSTDMVRGSAPDDAVIIT